MGAQPLVHGHREAAPLEARVGKRGLQGGARCFEPLLLGAPLGEYGLQLGWRRRPAGATPCSLCLHRVANVVVAVRVEGAELLGVRTKAHQHLREAAVDCRGGAYLRGRGWVGEGCRGCGRCRRREGCAAREGARRRTRV